jgi:hypothetical protein
MTVVKQDEYIYMLQFNSITYFLLKVSNAFETDQIGFRAFLLDICVGLKPFNSMRNVRLLCSDCVLLLLFVTESLSQLRFFQKLQRNCNGCHCSHKRTRLDFDDVNDEAAIIDGVFGQGQQGDNCSTHADGAVLQAMHAYQLLLSDTVLLCRNA